ncbi:hypothetical protein RyT2_27550 [Pseudolactococcus yaeyamensis]
MALATLLGNLPTELVVNAGPINGTVNSVGTDSDSKRTDFEDVVYHPTNNNSATSLTVKIPDEVTADARLKADAIANNTITRPKTLAEFLNAWKDSKVTYIEVEADIPSTLMTSTARPNGAPPLVVQGNGHTVDLGGTNLKLAAVTSETSVTFNNINFKEDIAGTATADSSSFLVTASGTGTKLTVNMHHFSLSRSDASSTTKGPIHGVYATGARVVFSGDNTFDMAGGIVRSVGSVEIANNASVTLKRNATDIYTSALRFAALPSGSVGKFSGLRIANGARLDIEQFNTTGKAKDATSLDGVYNEVTTGDDVTWRQQNFGYFIRSGQDTGNWTFGQKNSIEIPRILNGNALTSAYGKNIFFNAGLKLELKQNLANSYSPIQASQAMIRFISPNSLHVAIQNTYGNSQSGKIFYGVDTMNGKMLFTNATIQGWTGTNNSSSAANFTSTFKTLEVRENGSRKDGSPRTDANVFGNTTREFKIEGSGVGEIKINYIDQNGNKVGDTDMPLVDGTNFVGQSFKLATKEFAIDKMPVGYKWAIDEQVKPSAKTDAQSTGDTTNDADNGDAYGQANYAIVPMKGETYEYNIYVYTEGNPNITYTYVDALSGLPVATDKATVGSERAGNHVPAHIGNTIDWTSKLYTETNIPTNYVYAPSNKLPANATQPTTTKVTDTVTASHVLIYVYDPRYKGSLKLSEVPDLHFGVQVLSPENRGKIYPANFQGALTVLDDRTDIKDGWNLSVQQAAPLTSTDGKTILKNSLFFRQADGGGLTPLDTGSDVVVYDHTSKAGLGILETVSPIGNWNQKADGVGFYLQDNRSLAAGDYSTVLTWTLGAGPSA